MSILQDIRLAIRLFRRTPVATGIALLSIALSVAATAVMFAAIKLVLIDPLPYLRSGELVLLRSLRGAESSVQRPTYHGGIGLLGFLGRSNYRRPSSGLGELRTRAPLLNETYAEALTPAKAIARKHGLRPV